MLAAERLELLALLQRALDTSNSPRIQSSAASLWVDVHGLTPNGMSGVPARLLTRVALVADDLNAEVKARLDLVDSLLGFLDGVRTDATLDLISSQGIVHSRGGWCFTVDDTVFGPYHTPEEASECMRAVLNARR
jgi:hypothetical protein